MGVLANSDRGTRVDVECLLGNDREGTKRQGRGIGIGSVGGGGVSR